MSVFRVQVNYAHGTKGKWSNVWHVNSTTLIAAADSFETQGVPDLLPLLHNACTLDSILVSSLADDTFITRPINTNGTSVSLDNDQYVSVSVQPAVQMRQMHRKRRKVVAP